MQRALIRLLNPLKPKRFESLPNEEKIVQAIWLLNAYFTMTMISAFVLIYTFVFSIPTMAYVNLIVCLFGQALVIRRFYQVGLCNYVIHVNNAIGLLGIIYGITSAGGALTPALLWVLPNTIVSAFTLRNRSYFIWPLIYMGMCFYAHAVAPIITPELLEKFQAQTVVHRVLLIFVVSLQVWAIAKIHDSQVNDLNDLRAEQKKRTEENRNLVRILSHDLANPLMVIGLSTGSIKETDDEATRKKKLARVQNAHQQMKEIIEKVRGMMALADGKTQLNLEQTDLHQVVSKSIDSFKEKLEQKQLRVNINGKTESVSADPFILGNQVLNNLISNAIKFSKPQSEIHIHLYSSSDSDHEHVSIRDKGEGIPKDILEVLFSVDHKTSRPGTNGEKGTGFGMPIVKNAVELMRGKIYVQSKTRDEHGEECGTEFIVAIPRYSSNGQQQNQDDESAA